MQTQRKIQRLNNNNPDRDKFFFIFTPLTVDIECCCCFSLRTGMKILSFFFILLAAFILYSTPSAQSNLMAIIYLIFTGLFLIISISLYLSTNSFHYHHVYLAYVIFELIILLNAVEDICGVIMIYLGVIVSPIAPPVYLNYFPFVIISFILLCIITIWIEIYMLWLIYSYMIHLKHNRLKVIFGQEIIVEDIQRELEEPLLVN